MEDQVLLSIILAAALTLYISRALPIEITSLLIPPALVMTGLLDLEDALSGFSSSATVTVAAMFVLSAGLMRTGAIEHVALSLGRFSKGRPMRLLVLLALLVPPVSAFMNNTPVVVMMVPVILRFSRDYGIKPSKLLIPLSYFAILGGTGTLIGTSTNILVDEMYRSSGGPGFKIFEFTPLGLIYALAGCAFMLTIGWRLLPDRGTLTSILPRERSARFVTEFEVDAHSPLLGRNVRDIFADDSAIRLLEIVRREEVILAGNAFGQTIEAGDALIIEGSSTDIAEFLSRSGASLSSVVEDDRRVPMRTMELSLAEAVVLPDSPFARRTVRELALNRRFGVKVLAVQRRGRHHRYKIRGMVLRPGDVLLLQAGEEGFDKLHESEAVLLVKGLEQSILHRQRMLAAVGIMAAVMALAALTPIPIAVLAMTGAVLMILTRCLRLDEGIRSLEPSVLLLLAGAIPLGRAMSETGLAGTVVNAIMEWTRGMGPLMTLSAFYLITSLCTEILSNNATAVLMTPIALGIAARLGVDPKPFLMAIAFGASASFMTPIGYQTNTIVMGPGGYTFRDFLKVGVIMNLTMWILATFLIPVFWPF